MAPLILFFSLAIVLSVILAMIVLTAWLKPTQRTKDNRLLELNIDVFKQRLAELEEDYQEKVIDQKTYDSQKLALERQLLDISHIQDKSTFKPNWKSRLIFIIWIPMLSVMAYMMIGNRSEVYQLWQSEYTLGQVADDLLTGKIDTPPEWATKDTIGLISAMQINVHRHATDAQRWFRLSEVFLALKVPESAIEALSRAHRLAPDDNNIAITYAQASAFSQGGRLDDNIRTVLDQVLQKEPEHQGAQMLMVMGEMQAGNYDKARYWINLLKKEISSRTGDHTQALNSLSELETTINEREKQSQQAITIQVNITPEILGRVKKGDTLFVSVRPLSGGPPVAAKKLSADSLHKDGLKIKISDNDSIMPTQLLSQALQSDTSLVITARINSTGEAMPQSGDLISNPVPLDAKAKVTTVLIDKLSP